MEDQTPTKESCESCGTSGFNYCVFSKTLVAIPAFTLLAYFSYLTFSNPVMQIIGAVVAIAIAVRIAIWLDRIPLLQHKITLFRPKRD